MTVIAFDGKTIAADSRASDLDDGSVCSVPKLYRLQDGRIIGFSGNSVGKAWRFIRWLEAGAQGKAPAIKGMVFLMVSPDGSAECADDQWLFYPVRAPVAIGSGAPSAMTAMRCGKGAADAVREAIATCCTCFGPVVKVKVRATKGDVLAAP